MMGEVIELASRRKKAPEAATAKPPMRTRPILFSGAMVRKIIEGKKTQTRRLASPPPEVRDLRICQFSSLHVVAMELGWASLARFSIGACKNAFVVPCPYGAVGDRLWVRESFRKDRAKVHYRADVADADAKPFAWKPGRYMRAEHARLMLEITSVRCQRLQEITEEDARSEGVPCDEEPCDHVRRSCEDIGCLGPTHKCSFAALWNHINGKRMLFAPIAPAFRKTFATWEANPFVWAIGFRVLDVRRLS